MSTQVAPIAPLATPGVNTKADSTVLDAIFGTLRTAINDNGTLLDNLPPSIAPNDTAFTPQDYGAIGDGLSHPLSSVYLSLGAAQVVYPFATSLTQEIDYCAFKKMSDAALGAYTVEHGYTNARLNKPMYVPAGSYIFGNDTWLIRNTVSMKLTGAGRLASQVFGNGVVLAFDGLWYSQIEGIGFQSVGTGVAAVELDGNIPGHPYTTRGSQANTFKDCLFQNLQTNSYCFTINRQGSSGAQGSENLFLNCHFTGANLACLYQLGFNALNNCVFGGNFQAYNKDGIQLATGHIHVFNVGFQSTTGYTQVVNDGWDCNFQGSGVLENIFVSGCRTESIRFLKNAGSTPVGVTCITHNPSPYTWTAGAAVALNTFVFRVSPSGVKKLYRVTTAGNSAGAEPVWPDSGTVADGTAVWTQTNYEYIDCGAGFAESRTCRSFVDGAVVNRDTYGYVEITANYNAKISDCVIMASTAAGNIQVTLPVAGTTNAKAGLQMIVSKYDTANDLTFAQSDGGFVGFDATGNSSKISAGVRGAVVLVLVGGGIVGYRWMPVSRYTW